MNKDRWESLPDDLKQVFDRNCDEDWLREVGQIWREDDDHGIKVAVDAGNTYIVLTPEEMETFNEALRAGRRQMGERPQRQVRRPGDGRRRQRRHREERVLSDARRKRGRGAAPSPSRPGCAERALAAVIRWWALLGGLVTAGLAVMTAASAVSNILFDGAVLGRLRTGQALHRRRHLHVPALLPAHRRERHGRHLHRAHERGGRRRRWPASRRSSPSPSRCCCCARCRSACCGYMRYPEVTPVLQLPLWTAFPPILVSLALLLLAARHHAVDGWRGMRGRRWPSAPPHAGLGE